MNIVTRGDVHEFEAVLREWFQLNSIRCEVQRTSYLDARDVLSEAHDEKRLRLWVTFPKTSLATIYFVDPDSQRFLLRNVPLRNDFDEIAREQLVQVIVTSANAFMERRASTPKSDFTRALHSLPQSSPNRANTEQPALPGGPRPSPSFRPTLRAGGYYQIAVEQKGVVTQGPGLLLGVAQRWLAQRAFFDARVQYLMPNTVQTSDLSIGLRGVTFRAFIGIDHRVSKMLTFGAELGAGANRVWFDPGAVNGAGVAPQNGSALWRPAFTMNLRASVEFSSTTLTLLAGGTDYLKVAQYVVLKGQTLQVVYQPFKVEPSCALELSWN